MRRMMVCLLVACSSIAFGQPKAAATKGDVEQTLMQLERDWVQAGMKKDADAFGKIVADDWVSIDFMGKTVTKPQAMADMKSGASMLQSIELGDMKVRV